MSDQKVKYAAATKRGKGRIENCDRVFLNGKVLDNIDFMMTNESSNFPVMTVICDGVGKNGALAADITVHKLSQYGSYPSNFINIKEMIDEINSIINKSEDLNKSASTIAGVVIEKGSYTVFNIGDTRIYIIVKGALRQVSQDHVNEKGELTRCLGLSDYLCRPTISLGRLSKEMMIILCSDGVYKNVPEIQIGAIAFDETLPLIERCKYILDLAVKNDAEDDLSIIILEIEKN